MDQFLFRSESSGSYGVAIQFQWLVGGRAQVQILSERRFAHQPRANSVLISGKSPQIWAAHPMRISSSSSTSQGAHRNTPGPGDMGLLPDNSGSFGLGRPQISIGGIGIGQPSFRNLRNSILAAEVGPLAGYFQLNSETTRVGVVTFGEGAQVLQPLTHDFEQVRRALDDILRAGPYGGTNMAEGSSRGNHRADGVRKEEKKTDTIKVEFF